MRISTTNRTFLGGGVGIGADVAIVLKHARTRVNVLLGSSAYISVAAPPAVNRAERAINVHGDAGCICSLICKTNDDRRLLMEVEVLQADCRAGNSIELNINQLSQLSTVSYNRRVALPLQAAGVAPWRRGRSAVTEPAAENGQHGLVSGECRPTVLLSGLKAGQPMPCARTAAAATMLCRRPPSFPGKLSLHPALLHGSPSYSGVCCSIQ